MSLLSEPSHAMYASNPVPERLDRHLSLTDKSPQLLSVGRVAPHCVGLRPLNGPVRDDVGLSALLLTFRFNSGVKIAAYRLFCSKRLLRRYVPAAKDGFPWSLTRNFY